MPAVSVDQVYDCARNYLDAIGELWCRPVYYVGVDSELHLALRSLSGSVLAVGGAGRLQSPKFMFKLVFSAVRRFEIEDCYGVSGLAALAAVEETRLKRFSLSHDTRELVVVEAAHCFLSDLDPSNPERTGIWSALLADMHLGHCGAQ